MAKKIISELIGLCFLIACGSVNTSRISVGQVVDDVSELQCDGAQFYAEKLVKFTIIYDDEFDENGESIPAANATAVINIPQNGFYPFAGSVYPITAYSSVDTSAENVVTGSTFAVDSDNNGVVKFIVGLPCGGDYEIVINIFAGDSFEQITQPLTTGDSN